MLMNGRVDGKTAAVCEEVNKTWNPAMLFLHVSHRNKDEASRRTLAGIETPWEKDAITRI